MVYVGEREYKFGGMLMSHMCSPDFTELHAMASDLDLKREWFQETNKRGELSHPHYDVCKLKKLKAIRLGAVEVSDKELIRLCFSGEIIPAAAAREIKEDITYNHITIKWRDDFYRIPFSVLKDEADRYTLKDHYDQRSWIFQMNHTWKAEENIASFKTLFDDLMPEMNAYKLYR